MPAFAQVISLLRHCQRSANDVLDLEDVVGEFDTGPAAGIGTYIAQITHVSGVLEWGKNDISSQ